MTFASVITLLLSIAKAIPPLAGLCSKLIDVLKELDTKHNEAKALKRREDKLDLIDAAYGHNRVLPSAPEQRDEIDPVRQTPGVRPVPGMETGRADNDHGPGI